MQGRRNGVKMEQYVIKGGKPLKGEVAIGGAKNAALGILAAAIMTDDIVKDVKTACNYITSATKLQHGHALM